MKLINSISKCIFRIRRGKKFRTFKSFVQNFYDYHFEPEFTFNNFRITKCRFYEYPRSITIEIHSLSPGMIIGKRGKNMDALKEYMSKRYPKPVNIELKETNPFK